MRFVREDALSRLDCDRVSIDDVCGLFRFMPRWLARVIMGTALKDGSFSLNADGTYKFIG